MYIFSFEIGESLFHQKKYIILASTVCVVLQVDKELASGEYFLKEKERVAKKKELKKVRGIKKELGKRPYNMNLTIIFLKS